MRSRGSEAEGQPSFRISCICCMCGDIMILYCIGEAHNHIISGEKQLVFNALHHKNTFNEMASNLNYCFLCKYSS